MSTIQNLSAAQLRRAANIKTEIESLENELSRILGYEVQNGTVQKKSLGKPPEKGWRKMSAAARARIAKAAKARWAKAKAAGRNAL